MEKRILLLFIFGLLEKNLIWLQLRNIVFQKIFKTFHVRRYTHTHTHTHTHIYIYIYIYICVWLNRMGTSCLLILSLIRSSLRMSLLIFGWKESVTTNVVIKVKNLFFHQNIWRRSCSFLSPFWSYRAADSEVEATKICFL